MALMVYYQSMNLTQAHKMIADEMRKHGLLADGWTWKWDRATRRMGQCSYGDRRLSFSRALFSRNNEARCRDTVLHEIAHALVGPGYGHGPVFMAKCREIGAEARASYSEATTTTVPAKYIGTCGCGPVHKRMKRTKAMNSNRVCARCEQSVSWRVNRAA